MKTHKSTALLLAAQFGISVHCFAQMSALNDTGISYAGSYPKGIETCESAEFKHQDCYISRPFSYTKLSVKGELLNENAEDWACVVDNTTGLVWEVKSSNEQSAHYHKDTYTWYNSNRKQNGGNIGEWSRDNDTCFGYQANKPRQFCHVEQFASRVNKTALCGFNDWRVPTRHELTSLIDFGHFQPSIQSRFFPFTEATFYWVLEPHQNRTIEAWSVDFEFGTTSPLRKTDQRPVRLVRSLKSEDKISDRGINVSRPIAQIETQPTPLPASCNTQNVVASKDYTQIKKIDDAIFGDAILDTATQLVWQKCLVGQFGEDCEKGSAQTMTWLDAFNSVDKFTVKNDGVLGQSGWRVPNIRELASITELACSSPAINNTLFPTPARATLWSSSPYRFYDHYAWYWDSEDGIYIYGDRTEKRYVRLVRDAEL